MSKTLEKTNIFRILSAANKELVHSSMLKYLLDRDTTFAKSFFGFSNDKYSTFLELSDSVVIKEKVNGKEKKVNKKLRFDIVVSKSESNKKDALSDPIAIIENKYKSTPTIKQLELYDNYILFKKLSPLKVLMVYSLEQIPSDVLQYCEDNGWRTLSYFTFDSNKNLLDYLKELSFPFNSEKERFLFEDYISYLIDSFESTLELINSQDLKLLYDLQNNREPWAFFLYYLLGRITNSIEIENLVTNNDGGKNPIPSIAIWFKSKQGYSHYFGIDGKSLKLGFLYNQLNVKENESYKESFLRKASSFNSVSTFNGNIKRPSLKSDKNTISACSLVSFDITGELWSAHKNTLDKSSDMIIQNAAKIFKEYYSSINAD